jgi:hypothetical protein
VSIEDVAVAGGRFTVPLTYPAHYFNDPGRWLRISVRCPAGSGDYAMLHRRQPVTSSPFSIKTRGIVVDASDRVGIGTDQPAASSTWADRMRG